MALNGIDVSQYQGNVDWNQVKGAGIAFAMLRGGYGKNNVDPYFHQNASACQKLGIPFGIYWFSYAYNAQMAAQEAEYCAALAKQYKVTWPLAYDLEYDTVRYAAQQGITIGKALATTMTAAFCDKVKASGYIPMYYSNLDYYRTMFDTERLPYDLWFAQYASAASVSDMAMCSILPQEAFLAFQETATGIIVTKTTERAPYHLNLPPLFPIYIPFSPGILSQVLPFVSALQSAVLQK